MSRPLDGPLIIALGILHSMATLPAILAAAPYVLERGLIGGVATSVPPPADALPALAALFSTTMGMVLLMLGGVVHRLQKAGQALPVWLGAGLAATGLVGGLLLPPTGFWLVAALGAWMLYRRRHGGQPGA